MAASASSLKDPNSEYADRSSPLKQHQEHPTALPADCRYFANQAPAGGILMCQRPQAVAKKGEHLGSGPSLAQVYNAHYSGGFVDVAAHRLIVAAYHGGSAEARGAVVAVCLRTGDRTVISGAYAGEGGKQLERGAGPSFHHVIDVRAGTDGFLYAFSVPKEPTAQEIVRVCPESGDRVLVWKSRDARFGQLCASDAKKTPVQTHSQGFAVAPDGGFYLGIANPMTGRGLVHVSCDGSEVKPISVNSNDATLKRGEGPEIRGFLQGFTVHKDRVYAFTTQPKQFLEIDPSTGDRTLIVKGNAAGAIGERWAVWDEDHKVWWTAGLLNSVTVVAFDPATGKSFNAFKCGGPDFPWYPIAGHGPFQINSLNYGGVWKHPTEDRLLLAHDSVAIVELELFSGNSRILSL